MVNIGERVTVHTFAWQGREGTILETFPSVPCPWMPSVSTVATVRVRIDGRMTYRGREDDVIAHVTLDSVKGI